MLSRFRMPHADPVAAGAFGFVKGLVGEFDGVLRRAFRGQFRDAERSADVNADPDNYLMCRLTHCLN